MSSSDESDDGKDKIIKKLKADIKKLNKELKDKDETIEERDDEISRLKKLIKNLKRGGNVSADSDRDSAVSDSMSDKSVLEKEMKKKDAEIDKLKRIINENESRSSGTKDSEKKVTELTNENERLISVIDELKKSDGNASGQFKKDLAAKKEEIESLTAKCDALMNELKDLKKTDKQNNETIKSLKDQLSNVSEKGCDECQEKEAEMEQLKRQITKLEKGSKNKEQDRDLVEKVEDFKNGLAEISVLTRRNLKNMAECVQLFKEISKEANAKKPKKKESLRYSDNDDTPNDLKKRLLRQDNEIEKLNKEIEERHQDYKKKEKDLKRKLKQKDEDIEELKEELENRDTDKNPADKKKMKVLQEQIVELEEEIETKDGEIKKKDKRIKDIEAERDDLKTQLSEINFKLSNENKSMKEKIGSLQTECNALRRENDKMKDKEKGGMEQLQREIATLKNDKETLNRQLQESKELSDKKQKAITTMQDKMKNSKETEDDLNRQIAILVVDRDDSKRQLKETNEKYEQLIVVYQDHKTKIDELEAKIVTQERELRQLRKGDFNASRNAPPGNAANPPRGGKALPQWWRNHQEGGDNKNADGKVCPNCNTLFRNDEFQQHMRQCMADAV